MGIRNMSPHGNTSVKDKRDSVRRQRCRGVNFPTFFPKRSEKKLALLRAHHGYVNSSGLY
jgi:hypothetical protein